jgi:hypothetical protein
MNRNETDNKTPSTPTTPARSTYTVTGRPMRNPQGAPVTFEVRARSKSQAGREALRQRPGLKVTSIARKHTEVSP